jgi:hypothetical protein
MEKKMNQNSIKRLCSIVIMATVLISIPFEIKASQPKIAKPAFFNKKNMTMLGSILAIVYAMAIHPEQKKSTFEQWGTAVQSNPKSSPKSPPASKKRVTWAEETYSPENIPSLPIAQPVPKAPYQNKLITVQVLQQNSALQNWPKKLHNLNVLDNPELKWKTVIQDEGLNCGYHALRNTELMVAALSRNRKNPNISTNPFLDQEDFIQFAAFPFNSIFESRKRLLIQYLKNNGGYDTCVDPKTNQFIAKKLKENRSFLSESLKLFVNSNDGSIKLNDLGAGELERLIDENSSLAALKRNGQLLVIDFDPELLQLGVNPFGDSNQRRIDIFKASPNDLLVVLWNDPHFHHWVSYVFDKENNTTTVYFLNSSEKHNNGHPNTEKILFKVLRFNNYKKITI